MKYNWKKASVGTSFALAAVALGAYAYTRAHAPTVYLFANGVEVTSVDVQPDDLQTLLEAKIWKFNISLPDQNKMYNYSLCLCHHGKIIKQLGGFGEGFSPNKQKNAHAHLMIGMAPIDNTFGRAAQIRYSLHLNGGGEMGTFPNPFANSIGYSETVQFVPKNNLIYLMVSSKTGALYGIPEENDDNIALQITPMALTK